MAGSKYVCEHCNKVLASSSNLLRHQRTSKGCLRLQGKLLPQEKKKSVRKPSDPCPGCSKVFSRKQVLAIHLGVCPLYAEFLAAQEQDKKLQEALESQASLLKEKHEKDLQSLKSRHELAMSRVQKLLEGQEGRHKKEFKKMEFRITMKMRAVQVELIDEQTAHEVTRGKLEIQTDNVNKAVSAPRTVVNHVAPQTTINNTTNNLYIADLTPDLGQRLAGRIGHEQFWQGQVGIARQLRCLTDQAGNKHYRVKDENRGKFEVNVSGSIERDDGAETIIETVKEPVVSKIGTIKDELLEAMGDDSDDCCSGERLNTIKKAYDSCLAFRVPGKNRQFILGLTGKKE